LSRLPDGNSIARVSEVTRILDRVNDGDARAAEELLPLVYEELRRLAKRRMAQQPAGQTSHATALVHEAWLKLAGNSAASSKHRAHFFRAAAGAMCQILIDRARAKQCVKRGAVPSRLRLEEVALATDAEPETLLVVDEALEAEGNFPGWETVPTWQDWYSEEHMRAPPWKPPRSCTVARSM
jgi:RNA polymerase sigma factor (TIGR02999 family)